MEEMVPTRMVKSLLLLLLSAVTQSQMTALRRGAGIAITSLYQCVARLRNTSCTNVFGLYTLDKTGCETKRESSRPNILQQRSAGRKKCSASAKHFFKTTAHDQSAERTADQCVRE
jgi:hypothetical protein